MNTETVTDGNERTFLHLAVGVGGAIDEKENVELTSKQLAEYSAKLVLSTIESFMRVQRIAGVQTVHWSNACELEFMVQRCIEHCHVSERDSESLLKILKGSVVDLRPFDSGVLRSVCNRDMSAVDSIALGKSL